MLTPSEFFRFKIMTPSAVQAEVIFKLLYIGKSNKKFTHDRIYNYMGSYAEYSFSLSVFTNRGQLKNFNTKDDYFNKNFTFINDKEYSKYIRKLKLKKISNEEKLKKINNLK